MKIRSIARELARTDFAESHARTVVRVNISRYFKDKSRKLRFFRHHDALFRLYGTRTWSNLHKTVQQFLHSEVVQCRTKKYGSKLTLQIVADIKLRIHSFYQLKLVTEFLGQRRTDMIVKIFRMDIHFHLFRHHLLGRLEEVQLLLINIVDPSETRSALNRPCQRTHIDNQFVLKFVQQVERIFRLTVHLVHKYNDRRVAHTAHLHQFARLRFHTFRSVYHDDYAVYGCQRAVRVFRKVLMSRRIKDIHLIVAIIKLHHRSGYRDTTLLFDIHPVRRSCLSDFVRLHCSRHLDLSAKKQQFFRQRSFTGIRMCDNRKCSSSFYLLVGHISFFQLFSYSSSSSPFLSFI